VGKPMFFFTGVYETQADAERDYDAIKQLHHDHKIGTYDAAVLSKDQDGEVHVAKAETPVRHASWVGAAAGAGAVVLFPELLPIAIVGAGGIGAWVGHLAHGMSRKEAKEMATMLERERSALIVIGIDEDTADIEHATRGSVSHATRHLEGSNFEDAEQAARRAFERQEQPADAF
jgi:uncharacterized membrane protein